MTWPFAPLRPLSYGVILADPPWSFENWSPAGEGRNAKRHYPCMSTADIAALPAGHLAAGHAALFLWVCNPLLPDGMQVMRAWGFRYVTVAFIWVKRTRRDTGWHMGTGYWTRANSELCLMGTTGSPRRLSAAVRELVIAPRYRSTVANPTRSTRVSRPSFRAPVSSSSRGDTAPAGIAGVTSSRKPNLNLPLCIIVPRTLA